jgi:hypothetical protein
VRYFNIKPKNNRSIVGISGVLLLILGVVSLIFQSSTTVQVYGQVNLGRFFTIGGSDSSNGQDSDSDGTDIFTVYQLGAEGVKAAKVPSRGELPPGQDNVDSRLIIDGGMDPAIDVTPGGQVYVAAKQQEEIAFVGCDNDVDVNSCQPSKIVSNPDTVPPVGIEGEGSTGSCTDNRDNDGDGRIDLADVDCKWSSEQVSSQRGLCSDTIDNDNDRRIDSRDEDCSHPSRTASAEDTAETASAEDTAETASAEDNDTADVEPTSFNLQPGTTTSPQLTFVSTDGGDAPSASNTDIASDGENVYVVWEQEGGEIMLAASHNSGGTWAIVTVSNTPGASTNPSVAANGQTVHVTWQDDTAGNGDIFYARSTDGGRTFPPQTQINVSNTSERSEDHQLLAEGSNVYVVWVDYTTRSGGDIYFRKFSDNGGNTSSNTINLSAGSGQSFQANRDPDMAAQGSIVSVTWAAYPDRNAVRAGEILFRESSNSGSTFGNSVNVSQTPRTDSKEPQVDYTPASEGGERYLAFHDTGGPNRVYTDTGTTTSPIYNVLATESDNGRTFSALVNLSDAPNNEDVGKSTSQLEVIIDVAIWDPSGRRG